VAFPVFQSLLTLINLIESSVNLGWTRSTVVLMKIITMRKIWTMSFLLITTVVATAQLKQGKIIYERTSKMNIQMSDPAFANMIPPERKRQV
jgi:hypothetical protein